jgi:putative salt-induced outer membrane protein YdiY
MKNLLITLLFITATLTALGQDAAKDSVMLKDGSKIVGTITGASGDVLTIETGFAGTVSVDMKQIVSMSTGSKQNIALGTGSTLYGTITHGAGGAKIEFEGGSATVDVGAITAIWAKDVRSPLLPPPEKPRKWVYKMGVDVYGKTGSTEKTSVGGKFTATLASDSDRLLVYAGGKYSEENQVKSAHEYVGGIDYEYFLEEKHSWYARTELEYDDIEALDLRATGAFGYGYYFIRRDDHELRFRLGAQVRHTAYQTGANETEPGLDLGLNHMVKLGDWGTLTTGVTYTPSFDDFADYILDHETTLSLPFSDSPFSMDLGISNQYNSRPSANKERLDTDYFIRLVLTLD